jgi:iron(III) transport system ATP-binding protein
MTSLADMTPAPDTPPWLALDHIDIAYGARTVVEQLSMNLARGSIGCLLGPSGCGKTTVLRAIAGFEPLMAGEIRLDGERVSFPGWELPPERRRIGMVFQDHALFPHLTVTENVAFGLRGVAGARERVQQMMETVGLAHASASYPHELSGGQQQRVALARALAPQPRLLLLDEPFANLDVELRERLGAELRGLLAPSNTTALLVTHDQHEAFAIADEIGVMSEGRIQQWDSAYQLYHRPANRFVADFVGQGVFLPAEVTNGVELRLELGDVRSRQPFVEREVDVLLRPDDVVHDDASPLQAEVVAKAFRGSEFLYTLRLPSGATVLSVVPSHHHVVAYSRTAR